MNEAAMNIMQDAGLPMGINADDTLSIMPKENKQKFKCRACTMSFYTKQQYSKHRKTDEHKAREK